MFRRNESYKQQDIFGIEANLTKAQLKMWNGSKEHKFFESFFSLIDEDVFRVLYSEKKSRPNAPVNQMVGSLVLKHLNDWTYEELFQNLSFNMLTRHAIGIHNHREDLFAPASLYNFQNRVIEHFRNTGSDLFMLVFDTLTSHQVEKLGVLTEVQRGDSFLMGSNIYDSTRLGLLIEVVQRVGRILTKSDKKALGHLFDYYTKHKADYYCYRIKRADLPEEMEKVSELYLDVYHLLKKNHYEGEKEVAIFQRVLSEHFTIEKEKISIIANEDLHSGILLSPDDPEATFRKKRKINSKGFVGHLSETANPDNTIQLITDCTVDQNNIDDSKILEKRLPKMLEKTPDLKEYHADSAYASEQVDLLMKANDIKQIQATKRGRKPFVEFRIELQEDGTVLMACAGGQCVEAFKKGKGWRADFKYATCQKCPLRAKCTVQSGGTKYGKPKRYKLFRDHNILAHERIQNRNNLPAKKKYIRANVEATVKDAKRGMKNNKLRIRGLIKANFYLIWTALAINLGRITRYSNKIELYLYVLRSSRFIKPQVAQK